MRSTCDCRTMTAQNPCHFTGTARASCGDLAIAVRGLYVHRKSLRSSCDFFCSKTTSKILAFSARLPWDQPAMPLWGSAMLLRRVYGLRFYDFKFLYNSELNKIVEATTTIRRPKTARYRTISIWRSHENGNLGIVRSP